MRLDHMCPRFVRVVARPKFVGRFNVIVPVMSVRAQGEGLSLGYVGFDEDSVGTCNSFRGVARCRIWAVVIWTGN